MTKEHPITPPPELFKQWEDDILNERNNVDYVLDCAWRNGFQAGADQELDACCEWAATRRRGLDADLRDARRPKPPSLKAQALQALRHLEKGAEPQMDATEATYTIRRALEQLDD